MTPKDEVPPELIENGVVIGSPKPKMLRKAKIIEIPSWDIAVAMRGGNSVYRKRSRRTKIVQILKRALGPINLF